MLLRSGILLLLAIAKAQAETSEEHHFPKIPDLPRDVGGSIYAVTSGLSDRERRLLAEDDVGLSLTPDDLDYVPPAADEPDFDLIETEDDGDGLTYAEDLFEGDILGVSVATSVDGDVVGSDKWKNAVVNTYQKWPDAVIPYVISGQFSKRERGVIAKAVKAFEENSCVRWVQRNAFTDRNYVHILKDKGCYSRVGRQGNGGQVLSLGA